MTSTAAEVPEWAERMRDWRQGDYALEVPQILLATGLEGGDLVPSAGKVAGLVVVSQTCDIVNCGHDKEWVTVAALAEIDNAMIANVRRGRMPTWTSLEHPPSENVIVDLNQMMTLHKSVLAGLNRKQGFKTDAQRIRFANALSRKHGRFAFPDLFNERVLGPLRKRIIGAHAKDSDQGKVYRSISSTRVSASPSWDSTDITIGFRFVLEPQDRRQAPRDVIAGILSGHLKKIDWPDGFRPEDPPFVLQTTEEMTAQEWIDSQEIDWGFISWPTATA